MSSGSKRILLIEDNINLSKVLSRILTGDGYEVTSCLTAQAALEYIKGCPGVDLVILDLDLPDNKGLNLMDQIKSNDGYREVPIIINSGYVQFRSDFRSWLADSFLVKKSDPNELRENVNRILN